MAKIAFILLCHKDPEAVIATARRLTAAGDFVAIHYDGRSPRADWDRIDTAIGSYDRVAMVSRRVKCGWGEWSLVRATLNACEVALRAFPEATHLYLMSGDCMPIKSAVYTHAFLDANRVDYIESFDFFESGWIKTGMQAERLTYRHFLNERKYKWLFYQSLDWQKRLGLKREIPQGLRVMIGSQWWCLRRSTVQSILDLCERRRDIIRFFRTTWIPDETFFQTLVRHLIPRDQIRARTLTYLMFTDYGMPVTFYNDHFDLLLRQDGLFARKISPMAKDLQTRLGKVYSGGQADFPISDEGRGLHRFMTGRGREGLRFAPRIWEAKSHMAPTHTLMVVACKKWHVAKRLTALIRDRTGIPAVDYLFNEDRAGLPDMGGLETRVDKRSRHRRAIVRMVLDHYGQDRLVICVDPSMVDIIRDFDSDRGHTRVLEVDCAMSDDWLRGHAMRTGLASNATPEEAMAELLPTIRNAIQMDSTRLSEAGLAHVEVMREVAEDAQKALPLARFLGISQEEAAQIACAPNLFDD